jgi:hypothetical protein
MDDQRIRELAEEVLRELAAPSAQPAVRADLEARVAALESEVARLRQQRALPVAASEAPGVHVHVEAAPPHAHEHASHGRIGPGARSESCVLEPDKPCVQSGQCRSYGH